MNLLKASDGHRERAHCFKIVADKGDVESMYLYVKKR